MSAIPQRQTIITPADYLAQERQAVEKHEFVEGIIYAMAGASKEHNRITLNIASELNNQFKRRPCNVYANDMRVKVNQLDYTYPDVVAVCGEANFADETVDTLLNPVVIIEVLSTSTADYDRGKKAQLYRRLESLQDYVIVAQTPYYVEHYHRQTATQWLLTTHTIATDNLVLHSINASIAISDIYDKVDGI